MSATVPVTVRDLTQIKGIGKALAEKIAKRYPTLERPVGAGARGFGGVLVVDIETRPDPTVIDAPEFIERARAKAKVGNLTDPDKVKAKQDAAVDSARDRAALDPKTGVVASIAWGWLHDEPIDNVTGPNEEHNLQEFIRFLSKLKQPAIIAGFRHVDFDIPFVSQRCAVKGIQVPAWWPSDARPWSDSIFDARTGEGSLADYLLAHGLPCKSGSGADSLGYDWGTLADYNRDDVRVTRELIRKQAAAFPRLRRFLGGNQ